MANYLIVDDEIAGVIQDPEFFPGREIVEGPDEELVLLYFKDGEIRVRSPQPPGAIWDLESEQWVIPTLPPAPVATFPDWQGLLADLRGSEVWAKVYVASKQTLRAQSAWTLLYGTLTAVWNLEDLAFAISEIRDAMASISDIGDFGTEEIEWINSRLAANHFELRL